MKNGVGIVLAAFLVGSLWGWSEEGRYERRFPPSYDGIGKWYQGREISQVMGHQGAEWLERPEREEEEQPDLLMEMLGIEPGETVADIGAGTGYFSWRLAREVGAGGKVYAVDIQPEMLDLLKHRMEERGVKQVIPVLGGEADPKLPLGELDWVVMVDVYHEFEFPYEMLKGIWDALKIGGRVVFVEYRLEDPEVPIKRLHKMSEEQVRKEALVFPLKWERTIAVLPRQHVVVFEKLNP